MKHSGQSTRTDNRRVRLRKGTGSRKAKPLYDLVYRNPLPRKVRGSFYILVLVEKTNKRTSFEAAGTGFSTQHDNRARPERQTKSRLCEG